ncbi:DNA-directed RNA polymerase subunit omega [Bowdeniella nasicola]|uniref:DNA-directed RNA polymerase subunit omega n=1 Tax=Bowdeniella nasicola TaxID=208480 RepID=A0A1Q5Q3U1_9ACTO|nr:DNA-directed RNA polymerase subunit omega [Bowdeniella nasicola]OKL54300.1 DNA-directed RNA polymerase subunit omega [Bowdeniella nasicola]
MSGTMANPTGITNPPIDDLLEAVDSKYALVVYAAKRARQINSYNAQLEDNMMVSVGPLVDAAQEDKSLSIAMREINEGLLKLEQKQ